MLQHPLAALHWSRMCGTVMSAIKVSIRKDRPSTWEPWGFRWQFQVKTGNDSGI